MLSLEPKVNVWHDNWLFHPAQYVIVSSCGPKKEAIEPEQLHCPTTRKGIYVNVFGSS